MKTKTLLVLHVKKTGIKKIALRKNEKTTIHNEYPIVF